MRRHLTDCEKWRAIGRMEAGQTLTQVCKDLKVAKSSCQESGNALKTLVMYAENQVKVGNVPQQTQDRYLATIAKRNRHLTSAQIAREFAAATGTRLSRHTVSDRLHKRGLYTRKPMICVPLTRAAKCARLQ